MSAPVSGGVIVCPVEATGLCRCWIWFSRFFCGSLAGDGRDHRILQQRAMANYDRFTLVHRQRFLLRFGYVKYAPGFPVIAFGDMASFRLVVKVSL